MQSQQVKVSSVVDETCDFSDSDDELLMLANLSKKKDFVHAEVQQDAKEVEQVEIGGNDTNNGKPWQYVASVDTARDIPKFDAGSQESLAYLARHGYVVIRDAANDEEISLARDLFWQFVEETSSHKISRVDAGTWSDSKWMGWLDTGIFGHMGIGQSPFMWHCRSLPRVMQSYASVWHCRADDLITSFDGCGVFRPWRRLCPEWRTKSGWYHVDQGVTSAGKQVCVQGLLTLYDATPSTGGLTLIPGSHLQHLSLMNAMSALPGKTHTHDFVQLTDEMICKAGLVKESKKQEQHEKITKKKMSDKNDPDIGDSEDDDHAAVVVDDNDQKSEAALPIQLQPILVTASAGDLILWDSRTVHCNAPGSLEEEDVTDGASSSSSSSSSSSPPELMRIVAYICQVPAPGNLTKELLYHRRNAVECGLTTSHWPQRCAPNHCALDEDTYVCRFTNSESGHMTDVQRRLIGDESHLQQN